MCVDMKPKRPNRGRLPHWGIVALTMAAPNGVKPMVNLSHDECVFIAHVEKISVETAQWVYDQLKSGRTLPDVRKQMVRVFIELKLKRGREAETV
jgi:hypothetical protein